MASDTKRTYVPPHRRRQQDSEKTSFPGPSSVLDDSITYIRCINLKERSDKWRAFEKRAEKVGDAFFQKIVRFEAVNGDKILSEQLLDTREIQLEWDSTINAEYSSKVMPGIRTMTPGEVGCALSHIALWRELASCDGDPKTTTMLILEDDAVFTSVRGKSRFSPAFTKAFKQLPEDWAILYLGLSDRGERTYVETHASIEPSHKTRNPLDPTVQLYRPEYGYHTHAYVITKAAATFLIERCLPIAGPIDVWLADNQWFGLAVYCAVIPHEGWRNPDGSYEGALLVSQQRGRGTKSDVAQSSK